MFIFITTWKCLCKFLFLQCAYVSNRDDVQGCCSCAPHGSYQSYEFICGAVCPGLHAGNNNSYGCSRHPPTSTITTSSSSTPPGLPKPTPVNHIQFISPTFPFFTPPTPAPLLFRILLLCKCLDDNALHIMADRASKRRQWPQFVYIGQIVPCKAQVIHAHCLNPMHTLL